MNDIAARLMTGSCIIFVYMYKLYSHIVWLVWLTKCKRCRNKWSWRNLRRHLEICLAWLHENCRDRCRIQCLNRWSPDYGESIWANLLRLWPILISSKPLTLPKFFSRTWLGIHVNWQKRGVAGLILVNWKGKRDCIREFWTESIFGTPVLLWWFLRRNV
jgi:hypothetical protein